MYKQQSLMTYYLLKLICCTSNLQVLGWNKEFSEKDLARVLFAVIALGGETLMIYRECLKELEFKKEEVVSKKLRNFLHSEVYGLGFDEIFSKWLA